MAVKTPTKEQLDEAKALIVKQMADADAKKLTPGKIHLSPKSYEAFGELLKVNKRDFGKRPASVPSDIINKNLIPAGIVETKGVRSAMQYRCMCALGDVVSDPAIADKVTRAPRGSKSPGTARARVSSVKAPDAKTTATFIRYIDGQKENWKLEAREAVKNADATTASAVDKLGFDKVARYVHKSEELTSNEGWKNHLADKFGRESVDYFAELIDSE